MTFAVFAPLFLNSLTAASKVNKNKLKYFKQFEDCTVSKFKYQFVSSIRKYVLMSVINFKENSSLPFVSSTSRKKPSSKLF